MNATSSSSSFCSFSYSSHEQHSKPLTPKPSPKIAHLQPLPGSRPSSHTLLANSSFPNKIRFKLPTGLAVSDQIKWAPWSGQVAANVTRAAEWRGRQAGHAARRNFLQPHADSSGQESIRAQIAGSGDPASFEKLFTDSVVIHSHP